MHLDLTLLMVLIFAHLLSDYVFQTSKIAMMKAMNIKGVIIHEVVVASISLIVMSSYGLRGLLIGLIVSSIHFAIDMLKLKTGKYFKRINTVQFLLDQIMHVSGIVICCLLFDGIKSLIDINLQYVCLVNYVLIITYFSTVLSKTVILDAFNNSLVNKSFFIKFERIFDSAVVLSIAAAFFYSMVVGYISVLIVGAIFYLVGAKKFKYTFIQLLTKVIVYIITSMCFRFLINL